MGAGLVSGVSQFRLPQQRLRRNSQGGAWRRRGPQPLCAARRIFSKNEHGLALVSADSYACCGVYARWIDIKRSADRQLFMTDDAATDRARRSANARPAPRSLFRRHVPLRQSRARAEEIFFHFTFEKLAGFGIDGTQAILVDEHGLMLEPHLPSFFRYAFENALAERAGIGLHRQAFGFLAQFDALHRSSHRRRSALIAAPV